MTVYTIFRAKNQQHTNFKFVIGCITDLYFDPVILHIRTTFFKATDMQYFFVEEKNMPFVQRYSDVKKGAIIFAGNTLGLSKAANSNSPGTEGSIGAFTSLDTSLQVGCQ